jgi:D-tyrosyl-tRNA(Tyr) deacylase
MRALLQRVSKAKVTVDNQVTGSIENGLVVLLGVTHEDSMQDVKWLTNKIAGLRIYRNEKDKMDLSVCDTNGEILVISQFTLYGNANKGRRPDFTSAAKPPHAKELYHSFIDSMRTHGVKVAEGIFGAYMQVELVNDGPVTIMLESPR